ncbi:hypothetical protein IW136_003141 [Coemansia sp. RSA 678]|nr:hypothetical protein IW136_003141 [Coemansia sp. RSA 678]
MNPNIVSGSKEQLEEDAMEFDMDDMDDAGVLNMLEDLETQRPVIPDSPILRYSGVETQQTPARVSGNAMTGAPASARNLGFRPPPQPSHTPDRPRSFADVSSFVPSSAGSSVGAGVHRLSLGSSGINPSPPKRQHS